MGASWRLHNCAQHRVGQVSYHNQGRARVMAENKGLVRIYGHQEHGHLLAAEMLGPRVEHTAHLLSWSIQQRLTELNLEVAGEQGAAWGGARVGPKFARQAMAGYLGGRATTIYGGASEVQKDVIAKNVFHI